MQCDLLGGSAVVQRLVARAVAGRTDVPAAGVAIGATHTHGGPGQFLGTDFYNRFASNKPGFDAGWAQDLATRIADGVVEAVEQRRPARLAWGRAEVWGLTRNRSLPSYVRNDGADPRRGAQRTYVSVNPDLHLLRVDADAADGGHEPLAAVAVFSVHGTGVPMRSPTYNADLWAYVTDEIGHRVERTHGRRPVVGAVEGTHADVAPALHPGTAGHLEARRVGRAIGARAAELYASLDGQLRGDGVRVACGLREVDLERSPSIGGVTLPRRPAVGAALVAGAFENETPVIHRVPPFRPGRPSPAGRPAPGRQARARRPVPAPGAAAVGVPPRAARAGGAGGRGGGRRPAVRADGRDRPPHRRRGGGRHRWPRRRAGRRVVGGQRVLGLLHHPRGVRGAALRGRPHAVRPPHAAVPGRPRRAAGGRGRAGRPGQRAAPRPALRPPPPLVPAVAVRRRRPSAP